MKSKSECVFEGKTLDSGLQNRHDFMAFKGLFHLETYASISSSIKFDLVQVLIIYCSLKKSILTWNVRSIDDRLCVLAKQMN